MTKHSTDTTHVATAEAWDAIAEGYDTFVAPHEADLATAALRLAGLRPGDRFLDVAAGPGGLSLPAARLGAKIVATDWSPRMIARFEARVRDLGLSGAEGRVMDCHALDFPDDSFDVTGSQFGVMLVPDQPKALREMVRVTRPKGRVLLVAIASPAKFEALQLLVGALRAVVPGFTGVPDDPPPLEFQVSDPEVLRQRLVDAGLGDVQVDTTHKESFPARGGQDLWNWCLGSNPLASLLVADLSEDQKTSVRRTLDDILAERADDRGTATLTCAVNIGIGTK